MRLDNYIKVKVAVEPDADAPGLSTETYLALMEIAEEAQERAEFMVGDLIRDYETGTTK